MKKLKLLLIMLVVLTALGVQAQTNTGLTPYKDSKHTYKITRGMEGTTLTWSVLGGDASDYDLVVNPGDDQRVDVTWKSTGTFTLQVQEHRTDIPTIATGCPTIRTISVEVGSNDFDVYADLVTDDEACATVDPAIVVDAGTKGDNSDDNFGTTTREYTVTAVNAVGAWSFNYTLTHSVNVGDLKVNTVAYDNSYATGKTVNVDSGDTRTITVTYQTNMNQQDADLDLELTITGASDSNGTPDGNSTSGKSNVAKYTIRAVPATTGITVVN